MSNIYGESRQKEIAERHLRGMSKADLAREYSISPRTVGRYVEKWAQVVEEPTSPDPIDFTYSFSVTPEKALVIRTSSDGEVDVAQVNKSQDRVLYEDALTHFYDYLDTNNDLFLSGAFSMLHAPTKLEVMSHGRVTVDAVKNQMYFTTDDGRTVGFSGNLSNRVMDSLSKDDKTAVDMYMRFADKLSLNPSRKAVMELYDFLEAKDIEIDADGDLICFKKVRSDYTDCYTGTFDNSPGKVVRVERNEVDEDSSSTCSYGLHVCSFAYLPNFGGAITLKVKVNPKDVVSIPEDYYENDGVSVKAKMRVCEYEVLCDLTTQDEEE